MIHITVPWMLLDAWPSPAKRRLATGSGASIHKGPLDLVPTYLCTYLRGNEGGGGGQSLRSRDDVPVVVPNARIET